MNVDKIVSESLSDKAGEFKIEEYKYEEMLEYIERKVNKKNKKSEYKFINNIVNFIKTIQIKEFIEVAAFIMVLIAVPSIVNHSNSTHEKGNPSKIVTDAAIPPENSSGKEKNTVDNSISEEQRSSEACYKYINDNNYDIVIDSGASGTIQLPASFNIEKDGVKIGELLKDRNEKSIKEAKLDFSSYLGKKVYFVTAAVKKDNSAEKEIMVLSVGEKIIGAWTYPRIQEHESRQSDYILFMNLLR